MLGATRGLQWRISPLLRCIVLCCAVSETNYLMTVQRVYGAAGEYVYLQDAHG